ncbi:MAG: hypothetical protein JNM29_07910 [Candidatus Odyssella sp.]|nr:hypothetical protein [Candidatus Odyssella sp.]
MEADDVTLLQRWVADKSDLVEFEIVPVVPGPDTAAALAGQLQYHAGLGIASGLC